MQAAALITALFSVLFPSKIWFSPDQPLTISVRPPRAGALTLVLTDFTGKPFDASGSAEVSGERSVDLRQIYSQLSMPGTYVLFAVPRNEDAPGQVIDVT